MQIKRELFDINLEYLRVVREMETNNNEIVIRTRSSISKDERMAFIGRFKRACRAKGLTLQQLQVQLGKTNGYFRNMGYISKKMAVEVKKLIPDLNIDYINDGKGEMFVPLVLENSKKKDIPLVPITARGGTLTGFSEGVSDYDCERIISPIEGAELAITVTGDSMEPEYQPGCVVFVKKINEKAFIEWGKTYVLDTCNGVVIKKLLPINGDNTKFVCHSLNSNYPDFEVKYTDVYGMYKVLLQMSLK